MTRIKLLAISTVTAAMILGSGIVLAGSPSADDDGSSIDQTQQTTEWLKPKPGGRRSGGAGFSLKK
ncbi:MAG: hypothetical protein AB1Z67_08375 [Candidatus Limnocylindrales bacterium]